MPGLNISFSSDIRNSLFMIVAIKSKFWGEPQNSFKKFRANQDPINSSILNLFLFDLAHDLMN
jgi:hypothetical protein